MSEIYIKTVVNHEMEGFFHLFQRNIFLGSKIIQNTNVYWQNKHWFKWGKQGLDMVNTIFL